MSRQFRYIAILLLIGLTRCVEPIDLESIEFDDLLVVDALITDNPGTQTILLSRTHPLGQDTTIFELGAQVYLQDPSGRRVEFAERPNGKYQTSFPFAVLPGERWQLYIETSDQKRYESDEVEVLNTPEIDSLYASFTASSSSINNFGGNFDFFMDSRNTNESQYLRWTWNSTFELSVATPSRWLWTGGNTFIIREAGSVNDSLQVEVCWRTEESTNVITRRLLDPSQGVVKLPLTSFHSDEKKMLRGYSIEVKQYALSESSYNYWNEIGKSLQEQGGLSSQQVGTIRGNIRSLDNPDEVVLGIFDAVDEESVRRKFVAQDFNADGYRRRFQHFVSCTDIEPFESGIDEIGETMEKLGPGWAIAFFITAPPGAFYLPTRCSECTYYGDNKRPDYWE